MCVTSEPAAWGVVIPRTGRRAAVVDSSDENGVTGKADRTRVHDAFADLDDAATWLRAAGRRLSLTPVFGREEVITTESARRLVDLRDAIRRLAAEHTHDPRRLGQSPISDLRAATSMVNTNL